MFKLFKSKKQEEATKDEERLKASKVVTKEMKLASIRITYDVSFREPFQAKVEYKERPTEWNGSGVTDVIDLRAESWSELLDTVNNHFKGAK